MARSSARAAAMQLVYEALLGGDGKDTLNALIAFTPEDDDLDYIGRVTRGVRENAGDIDALIARYSPSRAIDRIARVDLCILRVAIFEMNYGGDAPESVVINEAVELAKHYSEPSSARFINGVLGALSRAKETP